MPPPFFFDFFAAVGEVLLAMEMRTRDKNEARRSFKASQAVIQRSAKYLIFR